MQVGDLVQFVDSFRQEGRGIGVVVGMEVKKFEPTTYQICFPNSKKDGRNHVIRVAKCDVRVVSEGR